MNEGTIQRTVRRRKNSAVAVAALAALLGVAPIATAGPAPAQKCESGKNTAAGKYAACMHTAQSKFVKGGETDVAGHNDAVLKCETRYSGKWQKLEDAGGVDCPSISDGTAIQDFVDACVASVQMALGGGALPVDVGTCNADLATCGGDLAACEAVTGIETFRTGQTTCWDPADTSPPIATVPCAGTGQDGEFQNGQALAYTDNGDGTITDDKTGLMWEKLDDSDLMGPAGIHDWDKTYTWADAFAKIADLNAAAFAGYTDWRLPNIRELETLKNFGAVVPAIDPAFHTACLPGCTVTTCSCTRLDFYWSSSSFQDNPEGAWRVDFFNGLTFATYKTFGYYVRAVRAGS